MLCAKTEKTIRDMNCVKAREEDYHELKSLQDRIRGLPEDFHLASRQRRLFKQGQLRSIPFTEMDRLMSSGQNPFERSFACSSPTPSNVLSRPLGLTASTPTGISQSPQSCSSALPFPISDSPGPPPFKTKPSLASLRSPPSSDTSCISPLVDTRGTSFYSTVSSSSFVSAASEVKKSTTPHPPPPRSANRRPSMANLFSRTQSNYNSHGKQGSNDGGDETVLYAFVFDDLLLLTTAEKEEERETMKSNGKQTWGKKKQGGQNIQASPTMSQGGEDNTTYTVVPRGGLSRILGINSRAGKGAGNCLPTLLEVEVLPLNMVSEGLRSSGSGGSITFLFSFTDDGGAKGGQSGPEQCSLWERVLERSFLSCIQARKKQWTHTQPDLSSPIFGAVVKARTGPLGGTLNTAQADWTRRREHVNEVVMNAARCGDRTSLTALLQAGLPFPRSPSQQNLSDAANRVVAVVESGSTGTSQPRRLETVVVRKSPSQSQLQPSSFKRSPVLSAAVSTLNISDVARVGDLGTLPLATRTLDEERREEKTWWSLRLREIEVEGEWNDELDRMVGSRRSRADAVSHVDIPSSSATRVRKGLPVVKPTER